MTRLWLDDLRPAPEGWEHVHTAGEAIAALSRGDVVEVSLDHDLGVQCDAYLAGMGPELWTPDMPLPDPCGCCGDGYQVATWIEEQAHAGTLAPLRWRVHSANPVGAKRMRAALESADRAWGREEA